MDEHVQNVPAKSQAKFITDCNAHRFLKKAND